MMATINPQDKVAIIDQQKGFPYDITTQTSNTIDDQINSVLKQTMGLLDMETGIISNIEGEAFIINYISSTALDAEPGDVLDLGQTYCAITLENRNVLAIQHMKESVYKDHPCYETLQQESYIGAEYGVRGENYGTFAFTHRSPKQRPFSDSDKQLVKLVGDWVGSLIEKKLAGGLEPESNSKLVFDGVVRQLTAHIENLRLIERAEQALAESEQRSKELAIINRVVTAIAESSDLKEGLQIISKELAHAVQVDQVGIALLNSEKTAVTLIGEYYDPAKSISVIGESFQINDNPATQEVIATQRPIVITEPLSDPRTAGGHELLRRRGVQSLAIFPLIAGNDLFGTVGLDILEPGYTFTPAQLTLAETIIYQAATAVQTTRLFEQTQTALAQQELIANQLKIVAEVGTAISTVLDLDSLLQEIVSQTKQSFNLYHAHIYLFSKHQQELILRAGSGEIGRQMVKEQRRISMTATSIVANSARSHQPVIVNNVKEHPDFLPHPLLPNTRSEMAVPMMVGSTLIGVLDIQADSPDYFHDSDILVQQTLASQTAVAVQNAQLYRKQIETAEKLREVDRVKTEFLASMSHELRTPLNSIIGFADVLLAGIDGELNDRMREDIELIRDSGDHLRKLIGDILDMSKIEAGHMSLHLEDIDIPKLVDEVVATASGTLYKKTITIQQVVNSNATIIWGDKTRLRQILWNIVGNAIKFTKRGNIGIHVKKSGDDILFTIRDTGAGIHLKDIPLVFERFRQADTSLTGTTGGTGLGMPISKHLVELHGGKIWFETKLDVGTTFYFTIPHNPHLRNRS